MMKPKNLTYMLSDIDHIVVKELLPIVQGSTILLLYGQLGAGKTTLIKALTKQLGILDNVSSPTFSYVNVYKNIKTGLTINHFDLYRLNCVDEFIDQGFDEWLTHKDTLTIIEWPAVIEPLLHNKSLQEASIISLSLSHDFAQSEIRYLTITSIQQTQKTK